MKAFWERHADDVMIGAGCVATVTGAALLSAAAAFILAGVELIALGVLVGLGGRKGR
jgi:hypothetical protein